MSITTPRIAEAEPILSSMDMRCGFSASGTEPVVLEHSASHLVLLGREAGNYFFRIVSQDAMQPLDELKLSTAFVASLPADGSEQRGYIVAKIGEDEEEIEIEPDPFAGSGSGQPGCVVAKIGEDEEEIEIEPDPFTDPGLGRARSLHSALHDLCLAGEVDDHGDSFPCATLLNPGSQASGMLSNGWGDDEDVFELVIDGFHSQQIRTVAIEATGGVAISGVLYDAAGRRLEQNAGDGSGFRIVRALPPGSYFVKVASRYGDEGAYALSVGASRP